jgi:ankyrin repeat protein
MIESKNKSGVTPLSIAARNGHDAIVMLLLEAKANTESKDNREWTPLMRAAHHGHEAVVKLLLEAEANVESKDNPRSTSLGKAKAVLKLLLQAETNVESKEIGYGRRYSEPLGMGKKVPSCYCPWAKVDRRFEQKMAL